MRDALTDAVAGNGPKPKMGRLSRMVNKDIMGVVVWLIVMCVVGGLLYVIPDDTYAPGAMWRLDRDADGAFKFVKMTARYFLICYQFVPISLYVSMMFFQILPRLRGERDRDVRRVAGRAVPGAPDAPRRAGHLAHLLRQDGTLTSNHMEFRRCFIIEPRGGRRLAAVRRPSPCSRAAPARGPQSPPASRRRSPRTLRR